jgi:pimeloyl-ACP methyl ester carboxylesterase
VHGLSGSSRWWRRNIGALAQRFEVYTIDLIGFGASRNRHPFVLAEAAGHLIRWMDQLGIARASFVGHSMGGFISAELAADAPTRVERLVLVDAAAMPFEPSSLRHGLALLRELQQVQPSFLPLLFADALRAGPATLWKAASELLGTDMRPKLAAICAPTLIIWGERDAIIPLDMGKRLAQIVPDQKLVVIKGAGHVPMWDCPRVFNQIVVAFLTGSGDDNSEFKTENSKLY